MFGKKYLFISMLLTAMFSTSVTAKPQYSKAEVTAFYHAMVTMDAVNNVANMSSLTTPIKKTSILKASFHPRKKSFAKNLRVTATAYTSHVGQTDSTPNIAAWGDRLRPGMKVIAVSRDLLKVYGLKHKQKVRIKGLKGEYLVLDKMNKRWRKKIDIYMGKDKRKAFRWGRRRVEIRWN